MNTSKNLHSVPSQIIELTNDDVVEIAMSFEFIDGDSGDFYTAPTAPSINIISLIDRDTKKEINVDNVTDRCFQLLHDEALESVSAW